MTIDERLDALTMNLELAFRDIDAMRGHVDKLLATAQADGENIRGLARFAEIHERGITHLEGSE